jgi:hypothetical protein
VQREVIINQPIQRHHGIKRQRWFFDYKDEIMDLLRGPSRLVEDVFVPGQTELYRR